MIPDVRLCLSLAAWIPTFCPTQTCLSPFASLCSLPVFILLPCPIPFTAYPPPCPLSVHFSGPLTLFASLSLCMSLSASVCLCLCLCLSLLSSSPLAIFGSRSALWSGPLACFHSAFAFLHPLCLFWLALSLSPCLGFRLQASGFSRPASQPGSRQAGRVQPLAAFAAGWPPWATSDRFCPATRATWGPPSSRPPSPPGCSLRAPGHPSHLTHSRPLSCCPASLFWLLCLLATVLTVCPSFSSLSCHFHGLAWLDLFLSS